MSHQQEKDITVTSAYAVVPTQEEVLMMNESEESEMVVVVPAENCEDNINTVPTGTLFVDQPWTGVSPQYEHIPEARSLTWRDDFFEGHNEEDVIAVFDFDYDKMEERYRCLGWSAVAGTLICFPGSLFWCLVGLVPCYLNRNVTWSVRARHVAVTRDGILFVQNERQACWGDQCMLAKTSRLVPFDQIQNIVITEAGTASPLSKIVVDATPSKLVVEGLESPLALKKLVLALKARQSSLLVPPKLDQANATWSPVHVAERIDRGMEAAAASSSASGGNEEVATLLREIRDELRQHNDVLQSMKHQHTT
jgi:hypothetical protein